MPRRYVAALVLALVAATLLCVLVPRGPATPPRGALASTAPRPETSIVTVPVELRLAELEAALDASIPRVLFQQTGAEVADGTLLDAEARRDGPITLRAARGALVSEVPVAVTAKAYSAKKAQQRAERGRDEPAGTRLSGRLVIQATTAYALGDEWDLRSTTTLTHAWTKKPTVAVGPIRVGVERIADQALAAQWPAIAAEIDARYAADPRLREGVERVWSLLATPRLVREEPATWWVGEPEALYATSPVVEGGVIRLVVGLAGRFAFVVGDPGPAPPLPPLPARMDPPGAGAFRLSLGVRLDWAALSEAAAAALVDTTWYGSAGTATIRGAELYPSRDRVVVALTYEADHAWRTDGTVYAAGRPVLDADTREVRFEDVSLGLRTWDDATATVGALAGRPLAQVLTEHLRFPFGDALDEARAILAGNLGDPTPRGDVPTGKVDSLDVVGLRLTDEAVVIDTVATGTLAVRLAPPAPAQP